MTEHNVNLNTPMMEQFMAIKEKTDAILFFRMGDFYEMFLDDALMAAKILEITLTKRNGVPMCGIPYHAKDSYIYKLIKAGKRVAVCEQVEDPKKTKKIVKREIVEILTPGTVLDNKILEAFNPNYIAAFSLLADRVCIAFCDVSTGEMFYSQENYSEKVYALGFLRNELFRSKPKEIIYPSIFSDDPALKDLQTENPGAIFYPVQDFYFNPDYAEKVFKNELGVAGVKGFGLDEKSQAVGVLGALIKYIKDVQMKELRHVKSITRISSQDYLDLSAVTLRNLELLHNLYDGSQKHTLFNILNECKTAMGPRLLQEWIKRPLIDIKKIQWRQSIVQYFLEKMEICLSLRNLLRDTGDIERLITRIYFGKANPRDIIALANSIEKTLQIKTLLLNNGDTKLSDITELAQNISQTNNVLTRIRETLNEEPPNDFEEGGVIREGINTELDSYRKTSGEGRKYIIDLQKTEIEKTGISSLKIKYNKIIGYYIEISKTNLKNVPDKYIRKQELVGASRYTLPELEEYENRILGAKDTISRLEKELFKELCDFICGYIEELKNTSHIIKIIDVLSSFAFIAEKYGYCLPEVDETKDLIIKDGRHPVVEKFYNAEEFIPNDVEMNNDDRRLLLITGPNMSGKSTYLRQTALIAVMAQMGSYTPATYVRMGIIDKIFTRIGASDSLVRGESTFLVEMTEAAEILNNATERSLIIMDEIGRGTSTYDGLSIAWAIVEYLTEENRIRGKTLFATHYHELTTLAKERGIENCQVSVKEWDDKILFLHKVVEGAASKSYGIQVARLAGIPRQVTERAVEILKELEKNMDGLEAGTLIEERLKDQYTKNQLSLFSSDYEKLTGELTGINLNKMTPIDALTYLNDLIDRIKRNKI